MKGSPYSETNVLVIVIIVFGFIAQVYSGDQNSIFITPYDRPA